MDSRVNIGPQSFNDLTQSIDKRYWSESFRRRLVNLKDSIHFLARDGAQFDQLYRIHHQKLVNFFDPKTLRFDSSKTLVMSKNATPFEARACDLFKALRDCLLALKQGLIDMSRKFTNDNGRGSIESELRGFSAKAPFSSIDTSFLAGANLAEANKAFNALLKTTLLLKSIVVAFDESFVRLKQQFPDIDKLRDSLGLKAP